VCIPLRPSLFPGFFAATDQLAAAITSNISDTKAKSIATALAERLKKKLRKPAG
jgi:hypothetical protein